MAERRGSHLQAIRQFVRIYVVVEHQALEVAVPDHLGQLITSRIFGGRHSLSWSGPYPVPTGLHALIRDSRPARGARVQS